MADRDVDPGALLVAVLTVGAVPLTEDGPWNWMNSVVAGVVLVVISCYLWPEPFRGDWPRMLKQTSTFILVGGFILAILLARWVQGELPTAVSPEEVAKTEKAADAASRTALVIAYAVWAGIVVVHQVWRGRRRLLRWLRRGRPPETAAPAVERS